MTEKRICIASGREFRIEESEIELYHALEAPLPLSCPQSRLQQRMSFRNFRNLFSRPCSATGERVLSMYPADVPFPVYKSEIWWGDTWDPTDYSQEIDFSRPFFEQYAQLSARVPRYTLHNYTSENSDYCNYTRGTKSCYLLFGGVNSERCLYGHIVWFCNDCIDCLFLYRCEACSYSIDLVDCCEVHYSQECDSCSNSYFLLDCQGCRDCYGCWGLRHEQYCIHNRRYSADDYKRQLANLLPISLDAAQAELMFLRESCGSVGERFHGRRCENSSGNHLYECSQTLDSFDCKQCDGVFHCFSFLQSQSTIGCCFGGLSSACLESITPIKSERVRWSNVIEGCANITLSEFCYSSQDLFGCIGMKHKSHCILNRQYSKREFDTLSARLVRHMQDTGEWGSFFPATLSPFAYNESIAQDYFPISSDDAIEQGWKWRQDRPKTREEVSGVSKDDSLLICPVSGKPFRYQPMEELFLAERSLPLPLAHPSQRFSERMKQRRFWNKSFEVDSI